MKKQRMLKLADLLEADAANRRGVSFNMGTVVDVPESFEGKIVKLDCGTHACAMGLAAISGAFKRAGLDYYVSDDYWDGTPAITLTMDGQNQRYDNAAMEVFGLSMREAEFLFSPENYPAKKLRGAKAERFVAQRIRDLANGKISAPEIE